VCRYLKNQGKRASVEGRQEKSPPWTLGRGGGGVKSTRHLYTR